MIKSYICNLMRVVFLSLLIFLPAQAVDLFDQHPIVAASLIATPLPLVATTYVTLTDLVWQFFQGFLDRRHTISANRIIVPLIGSSFLTAVISKILINWTFNNQNSRKKAICAAVVTNGVMSIAPFLYLIARASTGFTMAFSAFGELKYPIASSMAGSLLGAAYMFYEYYRPLQTTQQGKQDNKVG